MIPKVADVVIIGGGVMGLSTAYHLVRRDCKNVVLLEREECLGAQTTNCCAGGIRHQFSTRINIQMSILSIQMLEAFEEEVGYPVELNRCGYTFILTQDDNVEAFKIAVSLQHQLGVDTRWLSAAALHEQFPMMCLEDAVAGTFYQRDGLADTGAVVNGYAVAAKRLGATLLTGLPVVDIILKAGRVCEVVTQRGQIATRVVVDAAGPWAVEIGRMVNVALPVRPVPQQLLVTTPLSDIPTDLPVTIFPYQGLGFHREGSGLLTGLTRPIRDSIVNQADFGRRLDVDPDWEAMHCKIAAKRLPCFENARIVSHWAGLYEMTPDLQPILGRCPSVEGFYCIAGFSGHGFMHAPISGLLLSEEILDGEAHHLDISTLRVDRFQQKETLVEQYAI